MCRSGSSDLGFSAARKCESEPEVLKAVAELRMAPQKADACANAVPISIAP